VSIAASQRGFMREIFYRFADDLDPLGASRYPTDYYIDLIIKIYETGEPW
jgi:hypothetical protein